MKFGFAAVWALFLAGSTGWAASSVAPPSTEPSPAPMDIKSAQAVKGLLESEVAGMTGFKVSCDLKIETCLKAYERLLRLNWTGDSIIPRGSIVLISEKTNFNAPGEISLSYLTSDDELEKLMASKLGAAPFQTVEGALRILNEGWAAGEPIGQCTDTTAEARKIMGEVSVCPSHTEYYDRLFKDDTFQITLVRGYFDDPYVKAADKPEGARGDQVYPFEDESLYNDQIDELLSHEGFEAVSVTATEAVLERAFTYRGANKLARIRIVRSLVACPGETRDSSRLFRAKICDEQLAATAYAKKAFADGLAHDPLVIYSGHSREGHGPDFGPYHSKIGKFPIQAGALENVKFESTESLLYLNSCSSAEHFAAAVEKRASELRTHSPKKREPRGLTMIGNSEMEYWANNSAMNTRLIVGLLEGQCPEELAAQMAANRILRPNDSRAKIFGGFAPVAVPVPVPEEKRE
jgi:hypothetical protein